MRSPAPILTVSLALVFGSGYDAPVVGQPIVQAACELEQRLAPWRATCRAPIHFAAALPAILEDSPSAPTWAGTFSVFGRSAFPADRDNGAVWSGRGASLQLAFGVGGSWGALQYGIFPAAHWAQNLDFVIADTAVAGHSPYVYPWEGPVIDWPQRMGSAASRGLSPGQSFLQVGGWSGAVVGLSTENIWWGPSKRYPMLLGATSDGFPHVYGRPPTVSFGPFRTVVRAAFGRLTESEYFDQDDKNDRTLLSALRVEIGLGGLPGVQVAVTAMVRQPWDSELKEVLQLLVPLSTAQDSQGEDYVDGMGAVEVVLPLTSLGMGLHGTWGRGDFFLNAEDLVTEPEHNQFWRVGLDQGWRPTDDGPSWSLSIEYASSAASPSQFTPYRGPGSPTVYRHGGLRQGHTQRGQVLGPSIGPGARAAYVSLGRDRDNGYLGVLVERILWDIDTFRRGVPDVPSDGQDQEWLFGGRFGTEFNISGVPSMRLDAFGGASIRWNRQYIRFTGDLLDYPERETNFWLDLRIAWTPDRDEARQ